MLSPLDPEAQARRRSAAGESELCVCQLNTDLGTMVEVITVHRGAVDKFISDAVMAVFGSPVGRGVGQGPQRLEALARRLAVSVCVDAASARVLSGDSRFALGSFGMQEIKGLKSTEVVGVAAAALPGAGARPGEPPS